MTEHAQVLSIAFFFLMCLVFFSAMTETFLTLGNVLKRHPSGGADSRRRGGDDLRHHHRRD
jgi:hypothetical protein